MGLAAGSGVEFGVGRRRCGAANQKRKTNEPSLDGQHNPPVVGEPAHDGRAIEHAQRSLPSDRDTARAGDPVARKRIAKRPDTACGSSNAELLPGSRGRKVCSGHTHELLASNQRHAIRQSLSPPPLAAEEHSTGTYRAPLRLWAYSAHTLPVQPPTLQMLAPALHIMPAGLQTKLNQTLP